MAFNSPSGCGNLNRLTFPLELSRPIVPALSTNQTSPAGLIVIPAILDRGDEKRSSCCPLGPIRRISVGEVYQSLSAVSIVKLETPTFPNGYRLTVSFEPSTVILSSMFLSRMVPDNQIVPSRR